MTSLERLLARPVLDVAPRLLGALLRHETSEGAVVVRLTEVEAYAGGADPGSHAFRGLRPRTAVMFGPAGRLYVYFTYGMHWCANVVTGPEGTASAVLLRAGEVVEGHELARARRPACQATRDLARGPARLATALGLAGEQNGLVLAAGTSASLLVRARAHPRSGIKTGPRVGVSGPGGDGTVFPWRFWLVDEPTVSTYRPGKPSRAVQRGDAK